MLMPPTLVRGGTHAHRSFDEWVLVLLHPQWRDDALRYSMYGRPRWSCTWPSGLLQHLAPVRRGAFASKQQSHPGHRWELLRDNLKRRLLFERRRLQADPGRDAHHAPCIRIRRGRCSSSPSDPGARRELLRHNVGWGPDLSWVWHRLQTGPGR